MGLLCTILKVIVAFMMAAGVLLLTLGFVYAPNDLKFHVTSAKFTQFDYVDNRLHYNLALNITITNPNKSFRVYYDTNEVVVLYKNNRLDTQWLPAFFQDTKTTTVVSRQFEGERTAGIYHVDVKVIHTAKVEVRGISLEV